MVLFKGRKEFISKKAGKKDVQLDNKEESNYVTDKKYYMDKRLKYYCDLIINERLSKESEDDALMICEGDEGTGKSSMAAHIGYYIAYKTKRGFSAKTFHLDTDEMMKYAANTYRQVICWDEPAVSGMSDEWWNEEQRKLKKMLVMIRQHQHFYIFNFARFHKFGEFFVQDRSIGMIKTFKRNKIEHGHFLYFNSNAKEALWMDWKIRKLKNYKGNASFVGRFFTPIESFLTTEEYQDYKKRKDQAIINLVENVKKPNVYKEKLIILRHNLSKLKGKLIRNMKSREELLAFLGISEAMMENWVKYPLRYPKTFGLSYENAEYAKENEQNALNSSVSIGNTPKEDEIIDDKGISDDI